MSYTIEFDFGTVHPLWYAGWADGTLGFAPSLKTAALWDEREIAERFLVNGYGESVREHGTVIEVPA